MVVFKKQIKNRKVQRKMLGVPSNFGSDCRSKTERRCSDVVYFADLVTCIGILMKLKLVTCFKMFDFSKRLLNSVPRKD